MNGLINNNEMKQVRLDPCTHTLQTIDYAHHEIHAGNHFKAGYNDETLDTGDTIAVVFTTPNTTKWAHFTLTSQAVGAATVQLFEAPTLSAEGTAVTVHNRNRNSATVGTTLAKHTPTITTNGTSLAKKYIGGSGFKTEVGGEGRGSSEMVLKQNTQYLVLLTANADGVKASAGGDWYEHVSKD